LHAAGNSYPGGNLVDQGIRAALDTSPYTPEAYSEYVDTILFPDPTIYMFDWRALQNRGMGHSDLPPGSIILYRPSQTIGRISFLTAPFGECDLHSARSNLICHRRIIA
jgi:hypothetical protein